MAKQPTHIVRDNVKIPVEHVLSFKTEKAFREAMDEEGHFASETDDNRPKVYDSIWNEAHAIKSEMEAEEKAEKEAATSGTGGKDDGGKQSTKTAPAVNTASAPAATTGGAEAGK